MKVTIIGGGNMGSAIAFGLADGTKIKAQNITVINRRQCVADSIKDKNNKLNSVVNDFSAISQSDIIILAIKPWLIENFLNEHKQLLQPKQIILSIAAGITLDQLTQWSFTNAPVYRVMPNIAIEVKQSMTFVTAKNTTSEQDNCIKDIFDELGKAMFVEEKNFAAATSYSCSIAYAFRYIRASMEGGVEMGIYPNQGKEIVLQTLKGAIELLEANGSHPEVEIDKVTTPGGVTIKGLNEMEHAGFTSSVIRGLKASHIK